MSGPLTIPEKCAMNGCDRDAEYQICGTVLAKGYPGSVPAEFMLGLGVCAEDRARVDIKEMFPEQGDGWQAVCYGFTRAGKAQPDWNTLTVIFKELV